MEIKIYQTKKDNFVFMDLTSNVAEHDIKIGNFGLEENGYTLVDTFYLESGDLSNQYVLEWLFESSNRDNRHNKDIYRSVSVSDVIMLDERAYYCNSVGFKEIKLHISKGNQKEVIRDR